MKSSWSAHGRGRQARTQKQRLPGCFVKQLEKERCSYKQLSRQPKERLFPSVPKKDQAHLNRTIRRGEGSTSAG